MTDFYLVMEVVTFEKIILFLVLIASLSVHEWAHAISADLLGDPLPRSEGRVTLDPRAHADLLGTIVVPIIMIFLGPGFSVIGWGRPVNISLPNPKTRTRDDLLITVAGPLSNIAIAFAVTIFFGLWAKIGFISQPFLTLFTMTVNLNCLLFFFNLVPIPPLDGSHVLKRLIRMKNETFNRFSKYGFVFLLVLVNIESFKLLLRWFLGNSEAFFYLVFSKIVHF